MNVESRDSVSLKPAELDEFGQLLLATGLPISDEELDRQVESFPLVVLATPRATSRACMLGSLERIGGTPSILWGMGVAAEGQGRGRRRCRSMTGELTRRAAISFPDEDVLVAARLAQPSCYVLLQSYANVVPRPGYTPNGEDRAWGRRLAKRYGIDGHFDDREFKVAVKGRKPPCVPVLDTSPVKATGGAKIASLVGKLDAHQGQAMIAFGWAVAEELAAGSYLAAR